MTRIYQLDDDNYIFPPADLADYNGLLAFGGDLSPQRLIIAYANGIFPWYDENEPILWWSLDPRLVIKPGEMKISKSLRRTIKSEKFECRIDSNFREVMLHCASVDRKDQDGTWIVDDMIEAYCLLHELGLAHSFETYYQGELVGGLYGVSLGTLFCGESMFHTMADASKVAFHHLHKFLTDNNFDLIDCQQTTTHLVSLGAYEVPRQEYLDMIKPMVKKPTLIGNWGDNTAQEYYLKINIQSDEGNLRTYQLDNN